MRAKIAAALGIIFFFLIILAPCPEGMRPEAQRVAAVVSLMVAWWIGEVAPLAVTSLLPIVLFPMLKVLSVARTTETYANHYVFLMLGGLLIGQAMQRWNLHKRIALRVVALIGGDPRRIVLGFMAATAFISLWISNTATAMMMFPIGMAVILKVTEESGPHPNFNTALMLGIGYAASIGGLGTLIGTFPNVLFAGMVRQLFPESGGISFAQWFLVGFPLVAVFVPLSWLYLVYVGCPVEGFFLSGRRDLINEELRRLGPMSDGEKYTLAVFIFTALLWMFRADIPLGRFTIPGWSNLLGVERYVEDSTVAIFAATLLFFITVNDKGRRARLLDWESAVKIPWDVLLLFGGGFAIAEGFEVSQLTEWLGRKLQALEQLPTATMLLLVVAMTIALSEVNSNTATASSLLPILAATAMAIKVHPYLLMIPATMAASCGFMLPIATPPNAIVFGSGYIRLPQMVKAGLAIDIIGLLLIGLFTYLLIIPVFDLYDPPSWSVK